MSGPARLARLPDGGGGTLTAKVHEAEGPDALALTHGAGGNLDTPGLVALAERLAGRGIRVVRFNLPAAEAGRKRADRPGVAVRAIGAAVSEIGGPLFLGGRSFGGRMASMLLADPPAALRGRVLGAVLLAYPLKPPGKPAVPPERSEHLSRVEAPMLFVSGDRDPFAPPAQLGPLAAAIGAELRWIAGADHGFRVAKARLAGRSPEAVRDEIAGAVAGFVRRVSGGGGPGATRP